jgi:ATP-dependent Lon protease
MFRGNWKIESTYRVEEIVIYSEKYFICIKQHYSDTVTHPVQSDLYWMYIDNKFLSNVKIKPTKPKSIIRPKLKMPQPIKSNGDFKIFIETFEHESNSEPEKEITPEQKKLKRRLSQAENEIIKYKKSKSNDIDLDDIKNQILLLDIDIKTKSFILDKFNNLPPPPSSDYSKGIAWIKTVLDIPFNKYQEFDISKSHSPGEVKIFFENIQNILDRHIIGLDEVKRKIMAFIAKRIINPNSKGNVLALQGTRGIGKTKILRCLSEALKLPLHQINFGGMSDSSIITGHSETYVGSKPGKIVECLANAGVMNGIIYLDEIDKISHSKSKEINGILTHLLDEEQNQNFQDNYLSNIPIDLSKIFFVLSFNDESSVSDIVLDRMKIINISTPTMQEKLNITIEKLLPSLKLDFQFDTNKIIIDFDQDLIFKLIKRVSREDEGVRRIKKELDTIFGEINTIYLADTFETSSLILTKNPITNTKTITITQTFINFCIPDQALNETFLSMYM